MIIAQVTDTRVTSGGRIVLSLIDTANCLLRCIEYLNRLSPHPNILVMTRDFVESGRPEEYLTSRWILALFDQPIYIISRNHDNCRALREIFVDPAYLPSDNEFLHYDIDNHSLRLIGLDTTVHGKPLGDLCQGHLNWLDDQLSE